MRLWSALALGRLWSALALQPALLPHPPQLPRPSVQNYMEKRILSLVCSPEKLPCFFLAVPPVQTIIAWIWAGPASEPLQNEALLPCCWQGMARGVFVPGPEDPPQDTGSGW